MTDSNISTFAQICKFLEPFNHKSLELKEETTFSSDLELDSLAVMDFVAEIEDHYDIMVPLNILPDLENIGQVAAAVDKILSEQ